MARLALLIWSLGPMLWQLYTSLRPAAVTTRSSAAEWPSSVALKGVTARGRSTASWATGRRTTSFSCVWP